jgi:hypothetical protein
VGRQEIHTIGKLHAMCLLGHQDTDRKINLKLAWKFSSNNEKWIDITQDKVLGRFFL